MERAEEQKLQEIARGAIDAICELVDELEKHDPNSVMEDVRNKRDEAESAIHADPLCVEVRSGWFNPAQAQERGAVQAEEFRILLSTGGPATCIMGELDEFKRPIDPRIYAQDWGTPWTQFRLNMTGEKYRKLKEYCDLFYFGE